MGTDDVPIIEGFTVTRDEQAGEWVARSRWASQPDSPFEPLELRGRTQAELEERRRATYGNHLHYLRETIAGRCWPD